MTVYTASLTIVLTSANWVNHLQPLFVAGRLFVSGTQKDSRLALASSGESRFAGVSPASPVTQSPSRLQNPAGIAGSRFTCRDAGKDEGLQFATERMVLLQHLVRIQRETGWKTEDRARELRKLWGFE